MAIIMIFMNENILYNKIIFFDLEKLAGTKAHRTLIASGSRN